MLAACQTHLASCPHCHAMSPDPDLENVIASTGIKLESWKNKENRSVILYIRLLFLSKLNKFFDILKFLLLGFIKLYKECALCRECQYLKKPIDEAK